jgi:hypothetical protein
MSANGVAETEKFKATLRAAGAAVLRAAGAEISSGSIASVASAGAGPSR